MSKFTAILAAKNAAQTESDEEAPESHTSNLVESVAARPTEVPEVPLERKRGRPGAKRSDPKFVQTTAYIRKETLRKVKKELLELQGVEERDFSELVEELLVKWLEK